MKAWDYDVKEVDEKDIPSLMGLDIVAIQIAEPGAMGIHGGVFFVTALRDAFFTCYLSPSPYSGFHSYIGMDELRKILPALSGFSHGLMGYGTKCPEGWQHKYLGAGNHLLVRNDFYETFNKEVEKLKQESSEAILYNTWLPVIMRVLENGSKTHQHATEEAHKSFTKRHIPFWTRGRILKTVIFLFILSCSAVVFSGLFSARIRTILSVVIALLVLFCILYDTVFNSIRQSKIEKIIEREREEED